MEQSAHQKRIVEWAKVGCFGLSSASGHVQPEIWFCATSSAMFLVPSGHKLRTFLTMFGIAWGIVSIVLMVAAGEGLRKGQEQKLRRWAKT